MLSPRLCPCLAELRAREVSQTCPLCRAELPAGLDGLFDLAWTDYSKIKGAVERGEGPAGGASPAAGLTPLDSPEDAIWLRATVGGRVEGLRG